MDITAIQNFIIQVNMLDNHNLLKVAGAVVVGYITYKGIKSVSLHFDQVPKNISKVIIPSEIEKKYDKVDYNVISKLDFSDQINIFINVVTHDFNDEQLANFYNNINEVKISNHTNDKIPSILSCIAFGAYNRMNNTIIVNDKSFLNVIYHELFHLASYKEDENGKYCGFSQISKKVPSRAIGEGLNEGYTELITKRHFKDFNNENETETYLYLKLIAKKLDEIVGQDKMEGLYLDASLNGLIDELKKYISDKEIMQFIADTDFIFKNMHLDKNSLIAKSMLDKCINRINRFLIICYSKKLQVLVNNNVLTKAELSYKINEYISTLASIIKTGNYRYKLMRDDNIKNYIKESYEYIEEKAL